MADADPQPAAGGDPGSRGRLTVHDDAITSLAELAAAEVDGVASGKGSGAGRFLVSDYPSASLQRAGSHVRLSLDLAVVWPTPLSRVSAAVRDRVVARIGDLLPLTADRVDVRVARMATTDGDPL